MIELLWVDGTWAPRGGSPASEALRRALDPRKVRFTYVPYPATFGLATAPGHISAAASIAAGVRNLTHAVHVSQYNAVVGGYSQGAMVAYKFAREVLPWRRELIVKAVAAMGNPHEPSHHGRGGIAERLGLPRRLLSVWAPGDPIADLDEDAPLRSAWELTEWMSVRDVPSARRWLDEVVADLVDGPQDWWRNPDILASLRGAGNYVFGTQHTLDYVHGGHARRLARMIEDVAP
ncbi:lysin B [Gordonia phage RayTheFireFly]|nr:lysin B [Gordonia phage RayTheFireFly]